MEGGCGGSVGGSEHDVLPISPWKCQFRGVAGRKDDEGDGRGDAASPTSKI